MRYLLLHGFTGAPESFAPLSAPPGSVAPVLGGHLGGEVRGDFWDEVERLAALGQGCAGLCGYSLGGRLALGILARYPARFAHALVISAQPGLSSAAEREARRGSDAELVTLLRQRGLAAFIDHWEALPLWASQADLPPDRSRAQRRVRLAHQAEGLAQSLLRHGLGEMPDLRPDLPQIQTEVDVLVGERDQKFVALAQELTSSIPRATLHVAPRTGHNVLLERPERCASLLRHGDHR